MLCILHSDKRKYYRIAVNQLTLDLITICAWFMNFHLSKKIKIFHTTIFVCYLYVFKTNFIFVFTTHCRFICIVVINKKTRWFENYLPNRNLKLGSFKEVEAFVFHHNFITARLRMNLVNSRGANGWQKIKKWIYFCVRNDERVEERTLSYFVFAKSFISGIFCLFVSPNMVSRSSVSNASRVLVTLVTMISLSDKIGKLLSGGKLKIAIVLKDNCNARKNSI